MTIKLPIAAVTVNGEGDEQVSPGKGDRVTVTIEGTVTATSTGTATVEVESANGQPVGEPAKEESAEGEVPSREEMVSRMREADSGMGY